MPAETSSDRWPNRAASPPSCTALADPRQRIEDAFVDVGARLAQCAGLLNRITAVFEALPQDLESPELTEATARLPPSARRAQEISAAFAAEQTDIARLVAVVTAADHPISDLRRTVKMMGIVAVNARVVAAGIVGDSDDFDVFTTDIATLSDGAARTIQAFSPVYHQLTDEVHKAASQRGSFEASHRDTLSGLADRLATDPSRSHPPPRRPRPKAAPKPAASPARSPPGSPTR